MLFSLEKLRCANSSSSDKVTTMKCSCSRIRTQLTKSLLTWEISSLLFKLLDLVDHEQFRVFIIQLFRDIHEVVSNLQRKRNEAVTTFTFNTIAFIQLADQLTNEERSNISSSAKPKHIEQIRSAFIYGGVLIKNN